MKVLAAQSCPILCDPMDCSPSGSSVYRILQARILEWVAIPFSRESSWPRDRSCVFCIAGRFFTIWATREAHGVHAKLLQCDPKDWRRKWQPTPVFLPGESHGQRSLVGCSPWGRTESDTTEAIWQQTLRTADCQVPLSMGFSRQKHWSNLPFPPPVDLSNPGIKPTSLVYLHWQIFWFFLTTWVWVNSGSWWWTGRPGVLQSMGLQRVGHDWVTELNWVLPGKPLPPCLTWEALPPMVYTYFQTHLFIYIKYVKLLVCQQPFNKV